MSISLDIQKLRQEVAVLLAEVVNDNNIPVVISDQDNPPFKNWVSFKFKDWTQDGQEVTRYLNEDDDSAEFETRAFYTVNLEVVTIGIQSEQLALTLQHHFNRHTYRAKYNCLGMAYLSKTQIKPAPRKVDIGWEQRHLFEVKFLIRVATTELLDYIKSIEIEQIAKTDSGVVLDTQTIEINL